MKYAVVSCWEDLVDVKVEEGNPSEIKERYDRPDRIVFVIELPIFLNTLKEAGIL